MTARKSVPCVPAGLGLLLGCLLNITVCVSTSVAAAGSLDPAFGSRGEQFIKVGPGAGLGQVIPLGAGRLLAVRTTVSRPVTDRRVALARLLANGASDRGFGSGGTALGPVGLSGNAVVLGARGKLTVGGAMQLGAPNYPERAALSRYTVRGKLDRAFGFKGTVLLNLPGGSNSIDAMISDAHGKLLAIVNRQRLTPDDGFLPDVASIVRLNSNGTLDRSFGTNGVAALPPCLASARALLRQPDGRIVLGGSAPEPAPTACSNAVPLARLLASGRTDRTFGDAGMAPLP